MYIRPPASGVPIYEVTLVMTSQPRVATMTDRIAVLDGGRVIEFSDHDELPSEYGVYAKVFCRRPMGIVGPNTLALGRSANQPR